MRAIPWDVSLRLRPIPFQRKGILGEMLTAIGNAVKLRICVSRYDSAGGDRLLKFLRVLRLLKFPECADRC